jgi:hypothetical protein
MNAAPEGADVTGGWKVGDRVRFRHRMGFDAGLLRGTIVKMRIDREREAGPLAHFTVQIDPADGAGRLQLNLAHLEPPD